MKAKTARRFLSRNKWKMAETSAKMGSPSFWKRVEKCHKALELVMYKAMSVEERIYRMLGF